MLQFEGREANKRISLSMVAKATTSVVLTIVILSRSLKTSYDEQINSTTTTRTRITTTTLKREMNMQRKSNPSLFLSLTQRENKALLFNSGPRNGKSLFFLRFFFLLFLFLFDPFQRNRGVFFVVVSIFFFLSHFDD